MLQARDFFIDKFDGNQENVIVVFGLLIGHNWEPSSMFYLSLMIHVKSNFQLYTTQ